MDTSLDPAHSADLLQRTAEGARQNGICDKQKDEVVHVWGHGLEHRLKW